MKTHVFFSLLELEFQDADLQICCTHAFSRIPMRESTCLKRSERVRLVKRNQTCADAFLKCCLAAEKLRQRKMIEDSQSQLGRSKIIHINNISIDLTRYFPNIVKVVYITNACFLSVSCNYRSNGGLFFQN